MKKLLYLFLGIIIISSCTNDDFIEPLTETTNSEIVHEKLTYEQVSKRMDEKLNFDKRLKHSFQENYISSTKDLVKITNTDEEESEILIDYFFDPIHDNETYSFITHPYVEQGDYLEKFVITIEDGEQKVGYLRYYPTDDIYAELFTGTIEVMSLNRIDKNESYIENGITITNKTNAVTEDCVTVFHIKSTRCTHGGNHRFGQQCGPGLERCLFICSNLYHLYTNYYK